MRSFSERPLLAAWVVAIWNNERRMVVMVMMVAMMLNLVGRRLILIEDILNFKVLRFKTLFGE